MKPEDVRSLAKNRGIHPGKLSKTKLFKMRQKGEGNRAYCLGREDHFDAEMKGEYS